MSMQIFAKNEFNKPFAYWALVIFCLAACVQINSASRAKYERQYEEIDSGLRFKRNSEEVEKKSYRLPKTFLPINYKLYLHPNIPAGNFTGNVLIDINCNETSDQIVLHSDQLEIDKIFLENSDAAVEKFTFDDTLKFLIIKLSKPIAAGSIFKLGIYFSGNMLNKTTGMYRSEYDREDKTKGYIATTQFEPGYARKAFPCFDEPAMKATFEVTLVHPKKDNFHALSNMDIKNTTEHADYVEVHFNKSVPMSTYLACHIISDFPSRSIDIDSQVNGSPISLRAFARAEHLEKVDFALQVGKKVLEYYIQYFNISFPLPKIDMISIPDFEAGAMENWGLITYRETSILYDPERSSSANVQRIAQVVAHELAHMWFGNLVTMNWWNDIWLNEGFANFIQDRGINAHSPEWMILEQFPSGTMHSVMILDSTLGAHPIVQNVETPTEISQLFDSITYDKGACIIRMLEDFTTPEKFQQSITNYLNRFKYKNTVSDDLLSEIEKVVQDVPAKKILRTWIEQMGLPVVNVEKIADGQYRLMQKRFFSNPADYERNYTDSPVFNYRWSIPITYITDNSETVQRDWFYYDQKELLINIPPASKWLKFNVKQVGYYRVNYPLDMWRNFGEMLLSNPETFSIEDRAALLNDAFALADASQLPYDVALDLTKYLHNETNYVPWVVAATQLEFISKRLRASDISPDFTKYALKLITPIYEKVGWEVHMDNSKHLENRLRVAILNLACQLHMEHCLKTAAEKLNTWLANPSQRPAADIRDTVYYYGIFHTNTEEVWQKLWQRYVDESLPTESIAMLDGLSAIPNKDILQRFIDLSWNSEHIRSQDYLTVMTTIASNPIGEQLVWDYFRENWVDIVKRFGTNNFGFSQIIADITVEFSSEKQLKEVQAFYANKSSDELVGSKKALENIKYNVAWMATNPEKIREWIKKNDN